MRAVGVLVLCFVVTWSGVCADCNAQLTAVAPNGPINCQQTPVITVIGTGITGDTLFLMNSNPVVSSPLPNPPSSYSGAMVTVSCQPGQSTSLSLIATNPGCSVASNSISITYSIYCTVNYFGQYPNCYPCPAGAICPGTVPTCIPLPDYWLTDPPTCSVKQCPFPNACLGGSSQACAMGYSGDMCSYCIEGYQNIGQQCVSAGTNILAMWVNIFTWGGMIAALLLCSIQRLGDLFFVTRCLRLMWLAGYVSFYFAEGGYGLPFPQSLVFYIPGLFAGAVDLSESVQYMRLQIGFALGAPFIALTLYVICWYLLKRFYHDRRSESITTDTSSDTNYAGGADSDVPTLAFTQWERLGYALVFITLFYTDNMMVAIGMFIAGAKFAGSIAGLAVLGIVDVVMLALLPVAWLWWKIRHQKVGEDLWAVTRGAIQPVQQLLKQTDWWFTLASMVSLDAMMIIGYYTNNWISRAVISELGIGTTAIWFAIRRPYRTRFHNVWFAAMLLCAFVAELPILDMTLAVVVGSYLLLIVYSLYIVYDVVRQRSLSTMQQLDKEEFATIASVNRPAATPQVYSTF